MPEEFQVFDLPNLVHMDPEVGAVIVAFDPHVSYIKFLKAITYVKNPSVMFLVTCHDETWPTKFEIVLPGQLSFSIKIAVTSLIQRA